MPSNSAANSTVSTAEILYLGDRLKIVRTKRQQSRHCKLEVARIKRVRRNESKGVCRAKRIKRDVAWADRCAIAKIYAEAERLTRETGVAHHVDHIIPLQGRYVSGLHVESNLRVIPWQENLRKANRYEMGA